MSEIHPAAEEFIDKRVKQYQGWYDKKSVVAKSRYLRMRGFSVVAGGAVPVLINLSWEVQGVDVVKVPGYNHQPSCSNSCFLGECSPLS